MRQLQRRLKKLESRVAAADGVLVQIEYVDEPPKWDEGEPRLHSGRHGVTTIYLQPGDRDL